MGHRNGTDAERQPGGARAAWSGRSRGKSPAAAAGRATPTTTAAVMFVCLAIILGFASHASALDWSAWRGDGTGISLEKGVTLKWSATENVRWSVPVPG